MEQTKLGYDQIPSREGESEIFIIYKEIMYIDFSNYSGEEDYTE